MLQVLNKRTIDKLGSQMNDGAASKPSAYAMKLMAKMGWSEGKGLGKNEAGITTHVHISKREESSGLGSEKLEVDQQDEGGAWWHDAFASNLKAMNKRMKKSSKSDKKRKHTDRDESSAPEAMPSYEELFKATGGARLGMRARSEQKGKIRRTEAALDREHKSILDIENSTHGDCQKSSTKKDVAVLSASSAVEESDATTTTTTTTGTSSSENLAGEDKRRLKKERKDKKKKMKKERREKVCV